MTASILHVLPPRDGFGPTAFGAISLCVRDFTAHSRFKETTHITGLIDAPAYAGFHYHPLSLDRRFYERRSHAYLRHVCALAQTLSPMLIEVHNRPYLAMKLASKLSIPVALFLHNDVCDMRLGSKRGRRALVDKLAAIYCISGWVKERFMRGLPAHDADKLHVMHPGIGLPLTPPPDKEKRIACIARMTPDKGALLLAQALAQLLPDYPDWQAVIIGGRYHRQSKMLSNYEQRVADALAPCAAQAELPGFLPFDEAQEHFRRAAIAVVPSIWEEAFGRTAIEAMAQGCALIGSATGGMGEAMGEAGLRLQPCDVSTLSMLLRQLIEQDALREQQQQASLARAAIFEAAKCSQALDRLRTSLLRTRA